MRKPKRKTIKNKLDKIFSEVIRKKRYCQKCGSDHYIQCAHVFTRKNLSIRWSLDNAYCLCAGCHFWAHDNPLLFAEWVKEMKTLEQYDALKLAANTPRKWSIDELQELYAQLKEL